MKKLFFSVMTLMISAAALSQQLNIPKPSPAQKLEQEFATSKIIIEYSRPGVKGRTIYGGLVPFDSLWRTGANSSTKIYFGEDVMLESHRVPMGEYALYTIPGKESWTIILSKDTSLWGAFGYKKENDLVRFTVKPQSLPFSLETFLIDVSNIKPNACDIDLLWDKTLVRMHVTAEIDSKIMAQIDAAMKSDKPPYAQAARYYLDNDKDLNKAYEWINKAIEAKPESYGQMLTKAKIEIKLGKNKEAVMTAQRAKELSLKDGNADDARQADAIIAEATVKK
ncbi:MAG TPA: DUF2911 domain-containing protein [Chitinophagales bacterium]|nr:DUF2911 domain-containing protein [Chitinophagales bacterium]